jgi:hypothetical protein
MYIWMELLSNNNLLLPMQASFDLLDDLFQSKELQLNQAIETLEALRLSVKEASKKKDPDSTKKPKKGTKASKEKKIKRKAPVEDVDSVDFDDSKPSGGNFTETLLQTTSGLLQLAIEKRGYALFCVAAAGIYYFGEYASV